MDPKQFEKISKALGDPNRLMILKEIRRKRQNCLYCAEIYDKVSLTQPAIAHHIKLLTDADLIIAEKEGRNVKYSLNNEVLDKYIQYVEALKV